MPKNFKAGDAISSNGQVGVVFDVLHGAIEGDYIIKVLFIRNLGNPRPYDLLEVTKERESFLKIDEWEVVDEDVLNEAIEKRMAYLEKEANRLRKIVGNDNGT